MNHLTSKMIFLFVLGSGKHRSEIHAWQNRNIRHQFDWSKVSLYPSPSFLSKNQLAKEGRVVWPQWLYQPWPQLWIGPSSLTGIFVWSEHCATIWTGPQTSGRIRSWSLSPSRKVSTKTPATISSWIKQTVILCYELSDQEAYTLHQVKAHDVRAFCCF